MPETSPTMANPFAPSPHELTKARRASQAQWTTGALSILLLIPVALILGTIIYKGAPVISTAYLTGPVSAMGAAGGIWGPLIGTLCLTLICLAVVAPIGILGGIYLNEYAADTKFTRAIMLAVTSLAGVPSIVHALFGLGAFVGALALGKSLIAAALTLAVMNLPVMIASTREALAAVPGPFREACWNLGASKWQTIRTIVLPNSISGILTGIILVVARAAGETAPIMFTGVVIYKKVASHGIESWMPFGLNETFMALSYHLNVIVKDVAGVSEGLMFGAALVLLALIFIMNSAAIALRVVLRRRKRW